ncbi:Speckle-type POZ protein [Araneus ventricosus]|uniref:Speckle-type POZ protein n=1 Tax=Araneus ventricosus TaxID=182803 RepID=A0A4Y2BAP4_ARAVE|nr:Speckle-type POZ protein [Araneus ventricosus]
MATGNEGETNGCTFQWKIENISHCWWLFAEGMTSPSFIADALEGTKWCLFLYLTGNRNEEDVSVYLHRKGDCSGPNIIEINFQLAFLGADGSLLKERNVSKHGFLRKSSKGFQKFESRKKMFFTEKEAFLPQDALMFQCTLWRKDESLVKSKHFYARTVFNVSRSFFVWSIRNFSTVNAGLRRKFKDNLFDFDLVLNEDIDKKLDIDMISLDDSVRYISFNTSIIDLEEKKENCGIKNCSADDLKVGVLSPVLIFPKKLMENKSRYLPNDVLSLGFEFAFWTKESESSIWKLQTKGKRGVKRKMPYSRKEIPQHTAALATDLKSMYKHGIFVDTELRTWAQTFPAHRNILSARSPVFRSMFMNDMKETNSGHVDITDFEADTVNRMLLYIYTDCLEDLHFESASKLYTIADKYEILSLRSRCSSFLQDNLRPTNACDVLILADRHQDDDLKSAVQDYIVEHNEVFSSLGWKIFMDTNVKLAADIMYRKVLNPGKM